MKKILRKIYNLGIKRILPNSFKMWLKRQDTVAYPIIKIPSNEFENVYHIKDATWERMEQPGVYHLLKPWQLFQYHASQDILRVDDCVIYNASDIITTKDGCIWDKVYSDVFSKNIPLDNGVFEWSNNEVLLRKPIEEVVNINGDCMSLLGVHATIWSHFLVQFLPKLYYAEEAGLLENNITVILPCYKDHQVKELVMQVLNQYPKIKIHEVNEGARNPIRCERLYYIPTASALLNHAAWVAPFDIVIPKRVIDILHQKVIKPRIDKIATNTPNHDKIYLVRRAGANTIAKTMANVPDVEKYFADKGFYFVEPHLLTLEEKVNLFYHAKEIAGPLSSAWTNVIFCNGAKGIMFAPLCRTLDAYFGYIKKVGMKEWIIVTGTDEDHSIHSNYCIPIRKIDAAYKQLVEE